MISRDEGAKNRFLMLWKNNIHLGMEREHVKTNFYHVFYTRKVQVVKSLRTIFSFY